MTIVHSNLSARSHNTTCRAISAFITQCPFPSRPTAHIPAQSGTRKFAAILAALLGAFDDKQIFGDGPCHAIDQRFPARHAALFSRVATGQIACLSSARSRLTIGCRLPLESLRLFVYLPARLSANHYRAIQVNCQFLCADNGLVDLLDSIGGLVYRHDLNIIHADEFWLDIVIASIVSSE